MTPYGTRISRRDSDPRLLSFGLVYRTFSLQDLILVRSFSLSYLRKECIFLFIFLHFIGSRMQRLSAFAFSVAILLNSSLQSWLLFDVEKSAGFSEISVCLKWTQKEGFYIWLKDLKIANVEVKPIHILKVDCSRIKSELPCKRSVVLSSGKCNLSYPDIKKMFKLF